ncbi:hypothetical protein RSOLAG22IIIB_11704 [Rhizoctonia solani]|uniref:pectinesterase n=1 Tax=Rhizoctonia solani TaxID=456999 RepID=A0A0K6GA81_9AGAM|nr:hypothetical protein RSOLAG22IIIB_11704 [Rhizoctonia solani]
MLFKTLLLFSAISSSLCASSPPAGSITVGPGGQYSTLSDALTNTSSNIYFIYGTSIHERVVITRPNITIYAQTSNESTYSQNLATIHNNIPASSAGAEGSATVSVHLRDELEHLDYAQYYRDYRQRMDHRRHVDYYVIDQSNIMGTGIQYLGRPWRNYARVIFQNSVLGSQIQPAGWSEWSTTNPMTDHIFYGEFNNTG